ncbi:MAG: hypothetical protein CSA89_01570 [Bacteroidales bacterium]|nr:MAG: hypothetical protein CSA89_01570 [Bacteroidales bacterium]
MKNKELVQIYIKSVEGSNGRNNFRVLEFLEVGNNNSIPFKITLGMLQSDHIANVLKSNIFKRPVPYSVIKEVFQLYHIDLQEVIIFGIDDMIFAKIVLIQDVNKKEVTVRISDALALAIEIDTPIFVEKHILEHLHKYSLSDNSVGLNNKLPIKSMSISELQDELKLAVELENYEEAATLRDEIKKRKNK